MDITYLGHSSFKISSSGASLVTDPFDDSIGIKYPAQNANIVLVSHDHSDHNNTDKISGVKKIINSPGEYEIEAISIIGIPSFHDNEKGAQRGKNIIFVIEVDGFRIAHLGDLGHKLQKEHLDLMGDIDILLTPIGGFYTIDPEEAVEAVRATDPKIIIPMHYNTEHLNQEVFGKLHTVEDFVKELGMPAQHEDKFSLKPGSILPEEKQLIILSRK